MKKPASFRPKSAGNKQFTKKRLYDQTSWVEYRNKFLSANPHCYACGEPARVVDHVISHKGNEEKFWNETNMIPLCKPCHDYITGAFDKHIPPKTEEKMQWIARRRAQTDTAVRVKIVRKK
jgi:5-methylcytosine-specific restriction endonuclease McrA